jgi:hypothetical protein
MTQEEKLAEVNRLLQEIQKENEKTGIVVVDIESGEPVVGPLNLRDEWYNSGCEWYNSGCVM